MRARLILSFVLVVLVAITSMILIARQGTAGEVRNFMLRGGMASEESLVQQLEAYYADVGSWTGVDQLLFTLVPGPMRGSGMGQGIGPGGMAGMLNQRLRVADSQGTVVADTDRSASNTALSRALIDEAIPLKYNFQTVGYLVAESGMGFNYDDGNLLMGRITRAGLIAAAIAGGLSLLLGLYLAYALLRPVRALTLAAQRMSNGDLTQRVSPRGGDELAILGKTFNQMAESLQRYEENRKALTADIAHELRTPLAVQRANLEAMIDGVYPLTSENLAQVMEQNHLLTHMVDDLRTLALADAGQLKIDRRPCDLPDLIQRSVQRFTPQALERSIALTTSIEPGAKTGLAFIQVDPIRIEQIMGNLITNALRFTSPNSSIEITLQMENKLAILQVRDHGPGISEAALPYIFDRFYRADKSRSRLEGGSGLGLAIARQLALAHGGSLAAANHPQGGAIFTLRLPI
jgi:signal transduction histidine kinase